MNVALFTDTYPPEINGVATSTFNLRRTLMEHGHNVMVITTNPFNDFMEFKDGILRLPGAELKQMYGYRFSKIYNPKAMEIIAYFKPDVCHIQSDMGVGMFGSIVASRLHVGSIYTFHTMIEDYAYYVTKGHFDRFARHTVRAFYRTKSNLFDSIIAPSDKIKNYLRAINIDSQIDVIPTGIDLSKFDPNKEDKEKTAALKKSLKIAPDDYVILSLGRVAKEKSIDLILRAYRKFLDDKPKVKTKLVIVGWGPAEEELKEISNHLNLNEQVVFAGKCNPDETQDYYRLGDCFVSASLTETQGLTYMEAMAAHLIVLARYDDNLAHTISDDESGYFFFSEEELAQKLENVINLEPAKRKRIESNAIKAIDPYSMERFYENIYEVYNRVRKKNW